MRRIRINVGVTLNRLNNCLENCKDKSNVVTYFCSFETGSFRNTISFKMSLNLQNIVLHNCNYVLTSFLQNVSSMRGKIVALLQRCQIRQQRTILKSVRLAGSVQQASLTTCTRWAHAITRLLAVTVNSLEQVLEPKII